MKNEKRFTNQTFTKRVDHEGGLHRQPQKPTDPAYCEKCGSVYSQGRWVVERVARENAKPTPWQPVNPTTCPACKQIENHSVGGYVKMSGDFMNAHRSEIDNLVKNEAERALEDNPLSRIMDRRESKAGVTIETTTEHLAQRLGRALKKAFDGEVTYDFSHENKVARINWNRDH